MADEKNFDSCREEYKLKANKYLSREGYNRGGAVKGGHKKDEDIAKTTTEKGVGQHESNMHKGKKHTKLKLKEGGEVHGEKAHKRVDKFARGGKTAHKGGTKVNVIIAPQGGGNKPGMPAPMPPRPMPPAGAGGPPGAMPPRPAGAPMGAPPPGIKRGGRI